VRLLVLDHYFRQDIDALVDASRGSIKFDTMPFEDLREEALRVLPHEVASGLEAFASPELEEARSRFRDVLREILEDRFHRRPFDAIVMPSDTFFYVRATPEVAHALGVPVVVVQKETTISDYTMRVHSADLKRYAPPLADRMTVCSERHREFMIRAGADPASVVVTGQPRFDFYVNGQWPPRDAEVHRAPTVLFLSYAVDAYHPSDGQENGPWERLHAETEAGLHRLARAGWRVLIKPHPQQSLEGTRRWQERAGDLWNRRILPVHPDADTRKLIVAADVVVGFQTTAMLEAMLAGRPTVYTGWDPQAAELAGEILPFDQWDEVITVVRRADELAEAVGSLRGTRPSAEALRTRLEITEHYLGPLDGKAARRALDVLETEATAWAERRGAAENNLRREVAARRPRVRVARKSRAIVRRARRRLGLALGRGPTGVRAP
jgi:hypothetical protein